MFSSFRPVVTEENRRRRFRMIWPVSVSGATLDFENEDETATQDMFLDEGELFSQLCVAINLVREGKKKGMFVSHHNLSESFVRVFRRWLEEMASTASDAQGDKWDAIPLESTQILWVDPAKTIGLRFRVSLGPAERMPLLSGPGEDAAVSYTLTYEELLIQTTRLLLAVEESQASEGQSGAANSIILSSSA
ncbi:hypothetical protein K4F52_003214 [Lecanicillium sp. MT-2017a]|nr:hypothetical protein K4F52_003214 [Lecanicillium sp. MT-2017a]